MLTVLIATHNGTDTFLRTLEQFCALRSPPGGWKLRVINNASTDGAAIFGAIEPFFERDPPEWLSRIAWWETLLFARTDLRPEARCHLQDAFLGRGRTWRSAPRRSRRAPNLMKGFSSDLWDCRGKSIVSRRRVTRLASFREQGYGTHRPLAAMHVALDADAAICPCDGTRCVSRCRNISREVGVSCCRVSRRTGCTTSCRCKRALALTRPACYRSPP